MLALSVSFMNTQKSFSSKVWYLYLMHQKHGIRAPDRASTCRLPEDQCDQAVLMSAGCMVRAPAKTERWEKRMRRRACEEEEACV